MMRSFLFCLLVLFPLQLFAATAPHFLVHNGVPMAQLRFIAPSMELNVTYDAKSHKGMIENRNVGFSYSLSDATKEGRTLNRSLHVDEALFSTYPGLLFISPESLPNDIFAYWDKEQNELVLCNSRNGYTLELTRKLAPVPPSRATSNVLRQQPTTPWNLNNLRALITRHPRLVKEAGAVFLKYAACNGDLPALTLLLDAGVPANVMYQQNNVPVLQEAVHARQSEAAMLLLSHGANARWAENGESTLATAVSNEDYGLTTALLEHGVNPKINVYQKAIFIAVQNQNVKITRLLVSYGARLDIKNTGGQTPLLAALDVKKEFPSTDETLIMHAKPEPAIIAYLLEAGADVNVQDSKGNSPLVYAIRLLDYSLYSLLLNHGAIIDDAAKRRLLTDLMNSALDLQKQEDALKTLTQSVPEGLFLGSEIATLDEKASDLPKLFSDLLSHGTEITGRNAQGITPLHQAVTLHDLSYTKQLIAKGADVNAITEEGTTPLDFAIKALNTEAVVLLLENGVNVNAGDRNNTTPLDLAVEVGETDIVELLIIHGGTVHK